MGKQVSLKNAVVKRVHYPQVDGMPMYVRVDGSMDVTTGATFKSPAWEMMAQKIQTSPNNVRRMFVMRTGVAVDKYTHMAGSKGTRNFQKWSDDVVGAISETEANGMGMGGSCLTGSGLSALDKPWVCSNIEEVYFDRTILMSTEAIASGIGPALLQTQPRRGSGESGLIKKLFMALAVPGQDEQSIMKKFPRLRYVGYIDRLVEVYQQYVEAEMADAKSGANRADTKELTGTFTEHPVVSSAICSDAVNTHIWVLNRPMYNFEYTTRAGVYKFDRDVLDGYFKQLQDRLAKISAKSRMGTTGADGTGGEQPQSELEQRFGRIFATSGERALKNAIAIVFNGSTESERLAEYTKMSEEGKKRYGKYMEL